MNDVWCAASRELQRALFAVKDEMLADMRVDEIEAVVVARVPVNPDFTAGDAIGDGRLKQIGAGFVARMVVVLPYPVTKNRPGGQFFAIAHVGRLFNPSWPGVVAVVGVFEDFFHVADHRQARVGR